jgi:hypothetical protein
MNTIVRYLAGGALALLSQGFFAVSFGLPSAMSTGREPLSMVQLQDIQPATRTAAVSVQEVDRTRKSDRLPSLKSAPDPIITGNEFVANEPRARQLIKPVAKPVKRDIEPKLPEGCSSSVSPLSDRIAANQASNCVTGLELPWKVASAE